MKHRRTSRWGVGLAVLTLALTSCSNDTSSDADDNGSEATGGATASADATTDSGPDPFATENKATGEPITIGLLNLESGPVTFPGYRQAAEATIQYVNDYLGGVGGRPLQLEHCETDSQPATSQRCANQILDEDPAFILGGADTGASGAYEVWERAGMAVVGGVPFSPVEQSYANGVVFSAIAGPDNAAAVTYAQEQGADSGVVVYTSDTQGTRTGDGAQAFMENLGLSDVSGVPVPPTAADVSAQAATVVTSNPDAVFVTTPVGCASMLKSLDQLGFQGTKLVIDPCTDPRVIEAAGDGADGMVWGGPIDLPNSTPDTTLMMQILQKFAPDTPLTTISFMAVQSVMNIQTYLSPVAEDLTTESILSTLRSGADNANFASHPFTCDGNQMPGAPAVCSAYQRLFQYKDGQASVLGDWVDPTEAMG